jgi:predicted NACHT family NTPase
LAIIGENEKQDKKKEVKAQLGLDNYGITPTYEAIFEPKEPIDLDKLFERELKSVFQKRALIQGSAGVGKTTLCQHIAYRWAQGNLFQEFQYLFWLPLRRLNDKHYPSATNPLLEKLSCKRV